MKLVKKNLKSAIYTFLTIQQVDLVFIPTNVFTNVICPRIVATYTERNN